MMTMTTRAVRAMPAMCAMKTARRAQSVVRRADAQDGQMNQQMEGGCVRAADDASDRVMRRVKCA